MQAARAAHEDAQDTLKGLRHRLEAVETQLALENEQQAARTETLRAVDTSIAQARENLQGLDPPIQTARTVVATAKQALKHAQKDLAAMEQNARLRGAELQARKKARAPALRDHKIGLARVDLLNEQRATLKISEAAAATEGARTERLFQRAMAKANPAPATCLPPDVLGPIFELEALRAMDNDPPIPARYPALVFAFVCESWRQAALHPRNQSIWCYVNIDLDVVARAGRDWLVRILVRSCASGSLSLLQLRLRLDRPSTDAHRPLWQCLAGVMHRTEHLELNLHSLRRASEPAMLLLAQPAPHLRGLVLEVQRCVDHEAVPQVIFPGSLVVVEMEVRGCESLEHAVEPLMRGCGAELRRVAFDGIFLGGALAGVLHHALRLGHVRVANAAATSAFFDGMVHVCPRLRTLELDALRPAVARTPDGPYASLFDGDSVDRFMAARVRRNELFKLSETNCERLGLKAGLGLGRPLQASLRGLVAPA